MKYWFKRKRYGYGWVPCRWQGWLTVSIYVILVLLGALFLGRNENSPTGDDVLVFITTFIVATGTLLAITRYTAPKARWQWGGKSENTKKDGHETD